ncbi:homoserine dehydrogenase [Limosilactobacillus mucosae]|uniref:Homoserine dehydrogenase n=1 Tax=Limosilactobacillus mucosae TaxID=97478 RepID=A0AAJ1M8Z7_LIMMU|nr:homoserine dehydrogenase [Limosilactobacillus mucosae]MDC2829812.1 homoserine dehydrogenase [Limosilactobacillus mucosae]MDC2837268.1 homoserine dehydrogenase [Limosilactobacillus mucosae]MDC2845947.1 homoserine dehydrogenase [Limosilactobacillus mucosae]MDC2849490.1 homoserine dehydrogenase [Limosilactobacillus mucosae]MDC2853536.1 homoserine dehydrogenase [Limosilactobacillus mucosae]
METVKLGMLGLGTVGSGVLEMIENNESKIRNIIGRELSVKTVVVRHPEKHQNAAADIKLTTEFEEVLNDNEIQIVVELIGGIHPAKEYIERLLKAHKSVVTANKDLIASYGPELAALAYENHCDLMYEASVAGGIPILRTIVNSFAADNILEVKGIVNGTTNYILTQMNQKHWTYDEALKKAQELGFAEADPTNDVTGKDAAYKMIILSYFAFGTQLKIDDFKTEGIDTLNAFDVSQAESLGYVIKLVGSAKVINGGVFVDVAPTLVPEDHPLATINNEFNAVMVTGKAVGDTLFYGPGAGGLPTANSVLSDITSEVKNLIMGTSGHAFNTYQNEYVPADPDDVSYPYYLSLTMPDVSGQMLKFTKIMADVKASFSQIVQSPIKDEGIAHVAVITHELSQSQLTELKHQLHNADSIKLNAAYKVLEN